ncbi:hypothetical protein H4217_005806 [Coemansia sp. RSA 1939]|nr:hypothetical protein H4217_005806 [Coemansia sp. RSA 1939]
MWKWQGLVGTPKSAAVALLFIIFVVSYVMALQGGPLPYIIEHLAAIGIELLVSILSLTGITVLLYAGRMRRGARRNTLLLIFCTFGALYVYDHGERFEKHGFYNILVFLTMYVPLNLTLGLLYVLWTSIDNFAAYFSVVLLIGCATVCASLVHYRGEFDRGLFGKLQYLPGECSWVGPNIPIVDLFPVGTQNFWAGSMHCKPEQHHINATIDKHGALHVECSDKKSQIHIEILPDTRQWPLWRKSMWGVYNTQVLEGIKRMEYIPGEPVVLDEGTQAAVVRCGSSSTIVTRVSPSVDKLPLYTPPMESDTRTNSSIHKLTTDWMDVTNIMKDQQTQFKRPNVIYLMLDAVSHRQFYRRLPKSAKALRALHRPGINRLSELYRYHSNGFGTDNNTRAMYFGEITPSKANPLPIWAYYRDRGYVTARLETGCDDWAKECSGQYFESLDYSVGNRSLDYELSSPFCMPEYYPRTGNAFGNFKGPYSIVARCLYGRYVHDWAFDYLYQLRRELRRKVASTEQGSSRLSRPYMITAAFLEGHEGTGEVLRTMDDALAAFLEDLGDSGELEDTVFILGSDHGLHMGVNFLFLKSGRIEHQNPFFVMSVPEQLHQFAESFQQHHGSEKGISPFVANEQRLISPFEVYHTFRALADWPKVDGDNWRRSLFAAQRAGKTCDEAGIGEIFCMCK